MKKFLVLINRYQIFGIIVIAIGSLIVLYFNKAIFGTIVVALGTFLLTYGGSISINRHGKMLTTEFNKQLGSFEQRLLMAQKLSDGEKGKEISSIENEFLDWAKSFRPKKQEIGLIYQKSKVAVDEYIIGKSNEARPYYVHLFELMEKVLEAYNSTTSYDIKFVCEHGLAEDFYISLREPYHQVTTPYKASVSFGNSVKWLIVMENYSGFIKFFGGPQVNIYQVGNIPTYDKVRDGNKKFLVGIIYDLHHKQIKIATDDAYFRSELKENYPIQDYDDITKKIVKVLVEYQLSLI